MTKPGTLDPAQEQYVRLQSPGLHARAGNEDDLEAERRTALRGVSEGSRASRRKWRRNLQKIEDRLNRISRMPAGRPLRVVSEKRRFLELAGRVSAGE